MVEEGRRRGRYLLEVSVNGGSGGVDVGLVGKTYFRPRGEAMEEEMAVSVLAG